jgi:hypothetical protein
MESDDGGLLRGEVAMRRRTWKAVVLVGIGSLALAGCLGTGRYTVPPTLENGTAAVGLWHTFGGSDCTWERLAVFGGYPDQPISHDSSTAGPRYVEIKDGDIGFRTSGCLPWVQADGPLDKHFLADQTFTDGDYRGGVELAAGTYVASAPDHCSWERVTSFGGEISDIVSSGHNGTVTVFPGDYGLRTYGCGTWTRALTTTLGYASGVAWCSAGWSFAETGPDTGGPSGGHNYVVPSAGELTDWTYASSQTTVSVMQLEVWRPVGGDQYLLVGSSPPGALPPLMSKRFTLEPPISVEAGDVLGLYVDNDGSNCMDETGYLGLGTYSRASGPLPPTGTTTTLTTVFNSAWRLNVEATLVQAP